METRLVIAYLLIGLLVAAGIAALRVLAVRQRERRRDLRGHGRYKRRGA